MTLGSLRDQVIYPDTYEDMVRKGIHDNDLLTYLDLVKLTYIQERDGRWDAVADWMDVLSGGEKQRIAVSISFCTRKVLLYPWTTTSFYLRHCFFFVSISDGTTILS